MTVFDCINTMDKRVFSYIWAVSQKYGRVYKAAVFISKISRPIYIAAYAAGFFLLSGSLSYLPGYIFIPAACMAASYILRGALKRPRPYKNLISGADFADLPRPASYSCPSNHSASSVVIAAACMWVYVPLGIALFIFCLPTGLCRVFAGLHYPSDIAAGWALGLLFGAVFLFL